MKLTAATASPIGNNAKNPIDSPSIRRNASAATKFGGVPIKVIVPPILEKKASGINNTAADFFICLDIAKATGIRMATVPVLDMTLERSVTVIMNRKNSRISLPFA